MVAFRPADVSAGVRTLPGRAYTSEAVFALEQEHVFARHWCCVGRAEDVLEPGAFLTVSLAGESLLIVRDRAGELRAFYNVCRHRGSRLCAEPSGRFAGSIVCPYHAWAYSLDGRLARARLMEDTPGFDPADWPLVPVAVGTWEGFLFANLAPRPQPLEEWIAPLAERLGAWRTATLRRGARVEYDIAANWKLLHENYSECYHCALIHPELVKLTPADSGRNDLDDGPFLGGYMTMIGGASSMTTTGHTRRPAVGAVSGEDLDRIYYYSLFPNMLLSLHPDYVMAHIMWPESAGRTRVTCEWYFAPETIANPDFDPADAVEFWDLTNRQDWHACEESQIGLGSRGYTPGPYGRAERLCAAFDAEYRRAMPPDAVDNSGA